MNAQPKVEPTEKSQISVWLTPQHVICCRFSSIKKGEQAYAKLLKAWQSFHAGKDVTSLYEIKHDFFTTTVDLSRVCIVNFVDLHRREKFIPWQ